MPDAKVLKGLEHLRSGQAGNVAEAARMAGCARKTLSDNWAAEKKKGEGLSATEGVSEGPNGSMIVVSTPSQDTAETPESLMERHGFDPEEWVVAKAKGNSWNAMTSDKAAGDNRIVTMRQLTIHLVRRDGLIQYPDLSNWTPPPKPKPHRLKDGEPRRGLVIGDHHAPHHEPVFHRLILQWLRDTQPHFIDVNGDLCDFPDISRFRSRDEYNQSVNECLKGGTDILQDYREVCPDAEITLKRGNHDERLDITQIERAPELRKIAPGGGYTLDGEPDPRPWHSLDRLLYLDELHIKYIDEHWEQAKLKHSRKLTTRHGYSTAVNAGKVMLDSLSGSTIQGHDHRLSMTLRTDYAGENDDEIRVRMAMSGGCACIIPGGLGYVKGGQPDWQNAAVELTVWPDGDFHASPLIYAPGRLLAPNRRYVAE
jgi:hypothetical protein